MAYLTPEERINERIKAIRLDPHYNDKRDTPERRAAIAEMTDLYRRLFPEQADEETLIIVVP